MKHLNCIILLPYRIFFGAQMLVAIGLAEYE